MKKRKVNKKKFISRITFVLAIFIILILAIRGMFKKDNNAIADLTLVIDKQDVTDTLTHDIYISADGLLYMSMEDIKNNFDKNLYYEEETGKIITTSGTKTAAIDINNNTMEVNSAVLSLDAGVIKYDTSMLIPVSEMTNIYNIEVKTTKNSAVVLSLYKELTTVTTTKKVSLKENAGTFAKTIKKLEKNQELVFIENAEKNGWLKVLTYEGDIGYIREKDVGEKKQTRIDMKDSDFTSKSPDLDNSIEVNSKTLTSDNLKDFSSRKKVIDDTISKAVSKEKYTVNLNLNKVEVEENLLERLVIEMLPRLKEIGGSIGVTNNAILNSSFLNENNL